jgi:hypothetical protein
MAMKARLPRDGKFLTRHRAPDYRGEALIDVAPGAESLPLAASLAELVRRNIGRDAAKRAEFDRLRGAVAVVADDHQTSLTLRFDFGRLVVHTGVVGVPDITLLGPIAVLRAWSRKLWLARARVGEL